MNLKSLSMDARLVFFTHQYYHIDKNNPFYSRYPLLYHTGLSKRRLKDAIYELIENEIFEEVGEYDYTALKFPNKNGSFVTYEQIIKKMGVEGG